MKQFVIFILALFLSSGRISAQHHSNWESIFNGENLDGWVSKASAEDAGKKYWSVSDHTIHASSMGDSIHDYLWLLSEKEYTDFELKFKFRVLSDSKGNSGIQIRSRYDDSAGWLDGPQIDIDPNQSWRCGMMFDETRGVRHWIYPWIDRGQGWVTPDMALNKAPFYSCNDSQWNEMKVFVKGNQVQCFLNEVLVTDYNGVGFLDNELHSKYDVGSKGHLAFQIHIYDQVNIKFKDIYVREL